MYRALIERRQSGVHTPLHALGAGLTTLPTPPSVVSLTSGRVPTAILLHFRSLSAASVQSLSDQLLQLHLCSHLEAQASGSSLTAEKWAAMEAQLSGDCPPPGFFTVTSCSASCLVVHYNLRNVPHLDQPDEDCTLTLRCRRGDLEPYHYLSQRRNVAYTLHTAPYAFPHHAFLEWEFNHRFDVPTLLKSIYWSCVAVKGIHRFVQRCSAADRRAGYHHLHFHQQVTMLLDTAAIPTPPTAAPGVATSSVFLLAFAPALHTVTVLPQSSTRLRFVFRKQPRTTKADLRLLNGYAFVQDFLSADGRGREEKQPPGRVAIAGLESYLTSWYQYCGQHEQWKRVSKWNHTALTIPVHFDRQPLQAKPTTAPLISIRLVDTSMTGGLNTADGETLCRFFREWVCVPPYSAECMHSFLSLCSAPIHVVQAMMQLIVLQLQSRGASQGSWTQPLAVRWFHHLNAPFDLHYDAQLDVLFLVLQLSSPVRGDAVYVPVAYCLTTGCVGWWQMEEEMRQSEDKSQPPIHRSFRQVRRPGGNGPEAAPLDGSALPAVHLPERWKSLGALVEALMGFEIEALVERLSQLTPPLTVQQWCAEAGKSSNAVAEALKADQMDGTAQPQQMEITV